MEIRTRVREIRGERASLECEDSAHCGLCGDGRGCGLRLIGGSARASLEVPRSTAGGAPLATGDLVLVSVADGAIVRAAATTYLLPVAGLLAGAGLARWLGAAGVPELVAALAGALAGVWQGRRSATHRFRVIPSALVAPDAGDG